MSFLDKILEFIMAIMASCPGGRSEARIAELKGMIRKPGRVTKWVVKRKAKRAGIIGTDSEWDEAYAMGAGMSETELDMYIEETWSAF